MSDQERQNLNVANTVDHTARTTGYTICALLIVAVLAVLGACDEVTPTVPPKKPSPQEPNPQPEKDNAPRFKERLDEVSIEVVIITFPTIGAPDWKINCNPWHVMSKPDLPSAIGQSDRRRRERIGRRR